MLLFKQLWKYFVFPIIIFSFHSSLLIATPYRENVCDTPILSLQYTTSVIPKKELAQLVSTYEAHGHNSNKAKGIVGELVSRKHLEKTPLAFPDKHERISLFTLFKDMGCNVTATLRNDSDNGIDDIFVVQRKDKGINKNFAPVFHEAKYNSGCIPKLSDTKYLCQQMSVYWIKSNLQKSTHSLALCTPTVHFNIAPCQGKCTPLLQEAFNWLTDKLVETKDFYRTTSVLCSNGNLKIYHVN